MMSARFKLLGVAIWMVAIGWPFSLSAEATVTFAQRTKQIPNTAEEAVPTTINTGSLTSRHLADTSNAGKVSSGFTLYKTYCAQCHGRNLQGQPLWHLQDRFARQRAPAQDDTGHTWQHSDEDLFQIIRTGRFPVDISSATSFMPAFSTQLSENEILEIMSFIKSRWSLAMQVSQATFNPDSAGMPARAATENWTLPLNCITPSPNTSSSASASSTSSKRLGTR